MVRPCPFERVRQRAPRQPGDERQGARTVASVAGRPTASATSPVWIHVSDRPGRGQGQAESGRMTQGTRSLGSHARSAASWSAALRRLAGPELGAGPAALLHHGPLGEVVDGARPAGPAQRAWAASARRPVALATAISLVWSTCTTTSATDQPSHRDGDAPLLLRQPVEQVAQDRLLRRQRPRDDRRRPSFPTTLVADGANCVLVELGVAAAGGEQFGRGCPARRCARPRPRG